MFISMPKDFYVPVIFSDELKVNNKTGYYEYNDERSKKSKDDSKAVSDKSKLDNKMDSSKFLDEVTTKSKEINDIYLMIDDEYVNMATKK